MYCCSVGVVGLLAQLVECHAYNAKFLSFILSCDVFFTFFYPFPQRGKKEEGKKGRGGGRKQKRREKKKGPDSRIESTDTHSVNTLCSHSKFSTDRHTDLFSSQSQIKRNLKNL